MIEYNAIAGRTRLIYGRDSWPIWFEDLTDFQTKKLIDFEERYTYYRRQIKRLLNEKTCKI
jgi:hypothetical protein